MKKIAEWWHSYRMIATILAGVRHIFKLHPYNLEINLASGDRQLEWVRETISFLEMPSLVRKWVIWRHDRLVDFVNGLSLENAHREDMYYIAWRHYNEHVCEPAAPTNMADPAPAPLTQAEQNFASNLNDIAGSQPKKGKYEDG